MLALTRKEGQSIIIDGHIEIVIVEIKGDQVRIGINAPKSVKILRKEILDEIQFENKKAAQLTNSNLEDLNKLIKKVEKK